MIYLDRAHAPLLRCDGRHPNPNCPIQQADERAARLPEWRRRQQEELEAKGRVATKELPR